ncbi:olfactory receptor 2G3-like [Discoglossus pictus]
MSSANESTEIYFILRGISDVSELQVPIFLLVLLIYLLTLGGNTTILLLICLDHHLHTPMYFFLGNLSVMDISSTTTTLHKVLIMFITGDHTISFYGCVTQCYIFTSLTCNELLILTAMSYDRYVAICNPLHYHVVMNCTVCQLLAIICWLSGLIAIIPHVFVLLGTTCYLSREIIHFFCDLMPLQKLMCSNAQILSILMSICSILFAIFPPVFTFIPYVFIIATILRIKSSMGRRKAFYTCSSHLTVVVLLYVTLECQYMKLTTMESLESNKLFSLFNTAAVPLLNPLIYSLKNKAVKKALKRRLKACRETT